MDEIADHRCDFIGNLFKALGIQFKLLSEAKFYSAFTKPYQITTYNLQPPCDLIALLSVMKVQRALLVLLYSSGPQINDFM